MKKSIGIIIFLVFAIIIGFFIGTYLYNKEQVNSELENNVQNTTYNNILNNTNELEIKTSVTEEKININTQVIEEVYYKECDHILIKIRKDIKGLVNMTKDELQEKYLDWEIKEFTDKSVVLYKEEDTFCDEHYIIKDVDGVVTVYNMDNNEKIKERIVITEIETKYLPETDQNNLKEGIIVYSEHKLNKFLEDYE